MWAVQEPEALPRLAFNGHLHALYKVLGISDPYGLEALLMGAFLAAPKEGGIGPESFDYQGRFFFFGGFHLLAELELGRQLILTRGRKGHVAVLETPIGALRPRTLSGRFSSGF